MAIFANNANLRDGNSLNQATGIFGGTFNPVHYGHLHIALELKQTLGLDEMRLIPCAMPPHREPPGVTAEHRLAMLRLAIGQHPEMAAELSVDPCELEREGPSYSIDTLKLFREELGQQRPLSLCIGMDSFVGLTNWYRWNELLDYAHIVVAARPGWQPPIDGVLAALLTERQIHHPTGLGDCAAGNILLLESSLLPISATEIRRKLANNLALDSLLPDTVIDYIRQHGLYNKQEPA